MASKIGLTFDRRCLDHTMGNSHPERPERLAHLIDLVESDAIERFSIQKIDHSIATTDDLLRCHTEAHIQTLEHTQGKRVALDPDTQAGPQSYEAALWATGCALSATTAVVNGSVDSAFALIRPPGHHAEPTHAMGFCLFNNVAVVAAHARANLGLDRVAIIDFDVHHGNGTQSAFYTDPHVLYISSHQFPHYPGTGAVHEAGSVDARGSTINFPLQPGHGDVEYNAIYGGVVTRILEQFSPQLIIVSAGFDLMAQDPLGGMQVTAHGIRCIANALVKSAQRLCNGRIVFVLEGGYDLSGLQDGFVACLESMSDTTIGDEPLIEIVSSELGDIERLLPTYRELYKL